MKNLSNIIRQFKIKRVNLNFINENKRFIQFNNFNSLLNIKYHNFSKKNNKSEVTYEIGINEEFYEKIDLDKYESEIEKIKSKQIEIISMRDLDVDTSNILSNIEVKVSKNSIKLSELSLIQKTDKQNYVIILHDETDLQNSFTSIKKFGLNGTVNQEKPNKIVISLEPIDEDAKNQLISKLNESFENFKKQASKTRTKINGDIKKFKNKKIEKNLLHNTELEVENIFKNAQNQLKSLIDSKIKEIKNIN